VGSGRAGNIRRRAAGAHWWVGSADGHSSSNIYNSRSGRGGGSSSSSGSGGGGSGTGGRAASIRAASASIQVGESRAGVLQQRVPRDVGVRDGGRGGLGADGAAAAPRAAAGPARQDRAHRLRPLDLVRGRGLRLEEAARGDVVLLGRRGQGRPRRRVCVQTGQFRLDAV